MEYDNTLLPHDSRVLLAPKPCGSITSSGCRDVFSSWSHNSRLISRVTQQIRRTTKSKTALKNCGPKIESSRRDGRKTFLLFEGMGMSFLRRRSVRFGLPFLVLVVGGSFGLKEFAQIRYEFRNRKNISKEEAEKIGIHMKDQKDVTLETEFAKIEKIDTTSWENVRGPRPWEEGNQMYQEAEARAKKIGNRD